MWLHAFWLYDSISSNQIHRSQKKKKFALKKKQEGPREAPLETINKTQAQNIPKSHETQEREKKTWRMCKHSHLDGIARDYVMDGAQTLLCKLVAATHLP